MAIVDKLSYLLGAFREQPALRFGQLRRSGESVGECPRSIRAERSVNDALLARFSTYPQRLRLILVLLTPWHGERESLRPCEERPAASESQKACHRVARATTRARKLESRLRPAAAATPDGDGNARRAPPASLSSEQARAAARTCRRPGGVVDSSGEREPANAASTRCGRGVLCGADATKRYPQYCHYCPC